ncbi:MAG: MBL fold metallo-hydrolase [Candidatus Freyarchaeota archaeon]|nr:MBL fold metallo-hydrolase [Candidatus Jordarchaeia archaeon]
MGHVHESGKIFRNTYLIDGHYFDIVELMSLYVVKGEKIALIDAGTSQSAGKVLSALKELDLFPVDYIIITHEHADHIQGAAPLVKAMGGKVEVFAGKLAKPMIEDPSKIGYDFGMGPIEPVKNVNPLDEGDTMDLGGVELEVITVPGHTPGHIALFDRSNRNLFAGDSIGYKVDKTTFLAPIIPPWFNREQFYKTLDKLKKVNFETICLGHYGCWDGADARRILAEAREVFEKFWNFFDQNRDKLDDVDYLRKTITQKYLPNSKVVERVGEAFPMLLATHMRDGFKYANKIK